ncbi:hypothetical protein [Pseudohoeflea coraliihabitans]|uniref:Uncharacterized protein n=1 Tax=Pseudohoeflea coraliihabitans TaxID=2860393 RepID=A0ABS6WR17_9HYPH|nr:hypothetical protein [Pseudohoeflea sp. DP4N28-3]MBW3098424.1 hypothetical protein [Pseudohoeflea sp. DP4N28-3]
MPTVLTHNILVTPGLQGPHDGTDPQGTFALDQRQVHAVVIDDTHAARHGRS